MPTKIEWCAETINPLGHGCYGTGTKENPKICSYCYAYKLARRNIRGCDLCKQFIPHTHFEQLEKLQQWKKGKTIFVQSMGDLFGDWVSDELIQEVFNACEKAPQHRYLFLTKNPERYTQLKIFQNKIWLGTTVTNKHTPFFWSDLHNTFLSIEPIQDDFEKMYRSDKFVDWVIVGQESGTRKDRVIPKRKWIENIIEACRKQNVPVFLKNNLADIWQEPLIQDYPWGSL
jgi:protein gp37